MVKNPVREQMQKQISRPDSKRRNNQHINNGVEVSVSARMNAAKRTTTGAELFIRAQPSSKSSAELISYTLDNFVPTEGQSRKMKEALKRRKGSELLDKKK